MKLSKDEIIRSPLGREQLVALAREAGFARYMTDGEINWKMFERFAALVAAHEREACAKVCEEQSEYKEENMWLGESVGADDCAAAIRSRSKK